MKGRPAREIDRIIRGRASAPIVATPRFKLKPTTILFSMSIYRYPHPRTINLIEQMLNDLNSRRSDIDIIMGRQLSTGLMAARRRQFEVCLEEKADYMLISDDDMYWPQNEHFNALERMLSLDKDIVSAVCFTRQVPLVCLISTRDDAKKFDDAEAMKKGDPLPIKWTGFGLILIKRKVIEKLADYCGGANNIPNFQSNWRDHPELQEKLAAATTPEEIMDAVDWIQRRAVWWYEDYSFCKKARECGFEIWADPSFECAHIGDYDYGVRDWLYQLDREKKEANDAGDSA